jgi:AcrR family transcriptional regulator
MSRTPNTYRGTPLPRGRHKLDPHAVKSSQRERLLSAMLDSVDRRGYQATTVSEVVAAARVSTNAFYEFFDDKLSCFIALCDEEARGLLDAALVGADAPTWREALRRGVVGYLRWWQERAAISRTYLLELPSAGAPAIEQRIRASQGFADLFNGLAQRARNEQPDISEPPKLAAELLLVGLTELVAREVREGRIDRLTEIAPDVEELIAAVMARR